MWHIGLPLPKGALLLFRRYAVVMKHYAKKRGDKSPGYGRLIAAIVAKHLYERTDWIYEEYARIKTEAVQRTASAKVLGNSLAIAVAAAARPYGESALDGRNAASVSTSGRRATTSKDTI